MRGVTLFMETTSSQSTTLVSTVVETSQSCVYEGRDYEHGDYFQSVYNPCLNCCRVVTMSMETTSSQSTTLVSTVVETSQSCVYEGRDYEHGDYFQSVYNPCLNCCRDIPELCV